MNWNRLVGFYHVAKHGNFTKAAENVFVTQSALTHQIQALEAELGCLLFERIGKRKILLTAAGKRLFAFPCQRPDACPPFRISRNGRFVLEYDSYESFG